MKKIDLHVHTNFSDGIYSPREVLELAKESDHGVISITDHDNLDGYRNAIEIAKEMDIDVSGAAMASEAFFPFRDSIDAAAEAGVKAIIEPGGSIRDDEVIEAANEHGISLYFTTVRHFLH